MAEAKKLSDIGMKRGRLLANFAPAKQLDVIAEGLPTLMKSADDLLSASEALDLHHRAAAVLQGTAFEELAKILILLDTVRCPMKLRAARVGPMMNWFYNHNAKLVYAEAQSWKPEDVSQLQDYVSKNMGSHCVEGLIGEYIMPALPAHFREFLLYADIMTEEDGELKWSSPCSLPIPRLGRPMPWRICEALQNAGGFAREGLDIVLSTWNQLEFVDDQNCNDARRLSEEMLLKLRDAKLITCDVQDGQLDVLNDEWQLPMYHIDFGRVDVSLKDLQAQRDSYFGAETDY